MLLPSEVIRKHREKLVKFLWPQKFENPDVPKILIPKDQTLNRDGYLRPTWLALIFFFFSPHFIHRIVYTSLWPISPFVPEPLLPWTFMLCTSSLLFAF